MIPVLLWSRFYRFAEYLNEEQQNVPHLRREIPPFSRSTSRKT